MSQSLPRWSGKHSPPAKHPIHRVEPLENRRLLAILVVNDASDATDFNLFDNSIDANPNLPGEQRTLRAVIENHNARLRTEPNQVQFALGGGTPVIRVGSSGQGPLPWILGSLSINGSTGGATRVELDGSLAGPGASGLELRGYNMTIQGLVINRFSGHGIVIGGTPAPGEGGHQILNCYIGTDATGTQDLGNGGHGILIELATPGNTIGGPRSPQNSNVISGNGGDGIRIEPLDPFRPLPPDPPRNLIYGNYIGTNAAGNAALGNDGHGVYIVGDPTFNSNGTPGSTIGANLFAAGNIISANRGDGVRIEGYFRSPNHVHGNHIGTDATASWDLGNAQNGITLVNSPNNRIGSDDVPPIYAPEPNVISGNGGSGVRIDGINATGNALIGNRIGVDLFGTAAVPNDGHGVHIVGGASATTIGGSSSSKRNVISGNRLSGIRIDQHPSNPNPPGNIIIGNFIGTNAAGNAAVGNGSAGIAIVNHANDVIGGAAAGAGNVISGNFADGILLSGPQTHDISVEGNYIGTSANAAAPLGNAVNGVHINDAPGNFIGTAVTGGGNVISANGAHGIHITGATANGNRLRQNRIGTDPTGTVSLGNGLNGIRISGGASDNTIGGTVSGSGNIIAFNGAAASVPRQGHGVVIASGSGNEIRRNSIFANAGRGIDLGDDSFTLNDVQDADAGANGLQDYPVVSRVSFAAASKTIEFVLNSTPSSTFTVEFFSNTEADASGFGEGRTFLRDRSVVTNAQGNAIFSETFDVGDGFIAATATDANGNTSEFSMVDTDADAAADAWETGGIDFNEDGTIDLNLNSNPNHKDLWIEPDAMSGLAPAQATLNAVIAAFGNAPNNLVQNPDGANGITLHATLDETGLAVVDFLNGFAEFDTVKAAHFGTVAQRASSNSSNILAAKRLIYRYMVFGRQQSDSSSGLGELPLADRQRDPHGRNDFYVTLGHPDWIAYGVSADIQAGTFMHEAGHTLGLHHGGSDDNNYKPNYHSVMNYIWQNRPNPAAGSSANFNAYRNSWTLDYSRQAFANLNESALDEPTGIGGHAGHVLPLRTAAPAVPQYVSENGPVDWNWDGDSVDPGVSRDINDDGVIGTLDGHEDWSQLRYYFLENAEFTDGVHGDVSPEMSFAEFAALTGSGQDQDPPQVLTGQFPFEQAPPHRLRITFSENVSASLTSDDLMVSNLTTSTNLIPVGVEYDPSENAATFLFEGLLADGNYRATLPAGSVTDPAGNVLAADFSFDFFILAGDANRDRTVNQLDLDVLALNWQQSPRSFSQGDFNYDTRVDSRDLLILASRWRMALPAPLPAKAPLRSTRLDRLTELVL